MSDYEAYRANKSYQQKDYERTMERYAEEDRTRERPDVSKLFPHAHCYQKDNRVMWPGNINDTLIETDGSIRVHVYWWYNGGSGWYKPESLVSCTSAFAMSRKEFCTQYRG